MDIVYDQENWSTTHRIVYFIRNENHLKLKPFLMRLGHSFYDFIFHLLLNTIFLNSLLL